MTQMTLTAATLLLLVSMFPAARAAYPDELTWSDECSGEITFCATLEFCSTPGSSTYGYRIPGGDGEAPPCGNDPGPLIRLQPGHTYKLTLFNSAADSSTITNLHTHGLHIVGDGDSDNVLRYVEGGSCLDYTWAVPGDHPGGTYWYHPHFHSMSNEQTSGGALGMLIVDDNYNELNTWAWPDNEFLLLISVLNGWVLGNGSNWEGEKKYTYSACGGV